MGRRQFLDPATKRRNSLQCYLSDAEYHRVGRVAIKQDKHMSVWLREIVLCEVAKKESTA